MTDDLVVILTAFNEEYVAVRKKLTHLEKYQHGHGTIFEIGTVTGTTCRVALSLTGKGNQPAGILAERAIQHFSPAALIFVGVAGALWDTPRGDIVVATHVSAYHGATSEDGGLKARPRVWEISHGVSQTAQYVARSRAWAEDVPPGTEVHFGPITAGEIVLNSRISAEDTWIRQHYNDSLAIEMESAGVAQAGHLSGTPVAIVRGISDPADGTKSSDADHKWQPQAAANAAAFAVRLADELLRNRETTDMDDNTAKPHHGTVQNRATGSTVGIQAGTVSGSTVLQTTAQPVHRTPDLCAELVALRDTLAREHSDGRLDDATYDAAGRQLDIADNAAKTGTSEGKTKLVLALKQLGGLVTEFTGLAAKITALIVVAKGIA